MKPREISVFFGIIISLLLEYSSGSKVYPVRFNDPPDSFVADLAFDGICTEYEKLTIQKSEKSDFFVLKNHSIFTSKSLESLKNQKFLLNFLAERSPFERVLTIHLEIQNETSPEFTSKIYETSVDSTVKKETELIFSQRISLKNEKSKEIYFGPVTKTDFITIVNVKEFLNGSFAKIYSSRSPKPNEVFQDIWIGAIDRRINKRIAIAKIVVKINSVEIAPPEFEQKVYSVVKKEIPAHSTIVRVKAKSSRGTPIYRIEPESSNFDITPITGDIFSSGVLRSGRHEFHVVAKDALGQEGKTKVVVSVGNQLSSTFGHKAKRRGRHISSRNQLNSSFGLETKKGKNSKRDRATDIVVALKEDHPLGILSTQVSLFSDEKIDLAPIESDFLKIHENGSVELIRELNFESENEIGVSVSISGPFNTVVKEDNREHSVPVDFEIEDVNDNPPTFIQPLYTTTTKENIPIGVPILQVRAVDKDSFENGEVSYSVDHPDFFVNSKGEISAKRRLNADQNRERFFIYRFNVTAEDKGSPKKKSSTTVHIRTENTNDEPPVFVPSREYFANVAEDAQGGTPVLQIQAIDPDRDQVVYGFLDESGYETTMTELFEIDKDTGLIRLREHVDAMQLVKFGSPYNLTVVAKDDGSCCDELNPLQHTQTASVKIGIEDVNNNKPEFPDCATYSLKAKIEEGQYQHGEKAPVIITVKATDEDASSNGEIVYSLYYARSESRKPFVIDPISGDLRPSPHFIFDREQKAFEEVTVKATDKGERPLIGFCQFSVQVLDVNDNPPEFDRPIYETSISRSTQPGASVLTVVADDRDSAQNAKITFKLEADETTGLDHIFDKEFFKLVNENSGEITLAKKIPLNKKKFNFVVIANDNGKPEARESLAQVVVNVHLQAKNAPIWQSSPSCRQSITVEEDIPVYSELFKCHATSVDSKSQISYKMTNGVKLGTNYKQKFREFQIKENGADWVVIRNMESLDFEEISNYTLTVAATDVRSQVSTNKQFTVIMKDKNDNVPRFTVDRFTGTIDEELLPVEYMEKLNGKPITTVKAEDADSVGPQSEIRYAIVQDSSSSAWKYFRIDEITGGIFPLDKFDREEQDSFIFDVEAMDSMPSSLPGATGTNKDIVKVQIFIADINDNPPYFTEKKYEGRVKENAEIYTDVLTVKAQDLDR
ncbi:hypothetical protein FO519_008238, partial [Halicephalobus sp. NKZ332]